MDATTPTGRAGQPPRLPDLLDRLADGSGLRAAGEELGGLRAGRDVLLAALPGEREPPDGPAPGWWDAKSRGLRLVEADLAGARLSDADLGGANLSRAVLRGAVARGARFEGCILEDADLGEGDMSGACFASVVAGEATFSGAMLEDADFSDASMRFARLGEASLDGARFDRADLWGARFAGADADGTSFKGARLDEADLSDVNLTGSDFTGASLKRAKLSGSRLRGSDFSDARLDGTDLSGADLSGATLVRLNMATCDIRHLRLAGAWLSETRLRVEQLGGAVGEEVAGEWENAEAAYQVLERNQLSIGAKEEARWAYKRGRRMGRIHSGKAAQAAWRGRDLAGFRRHGYGWAADRFVEWLCDYGESLSRIVRAFILLIVVFAACYGLFGTGLIGEGGVAATNPIDLLSYSALNMLTSNPPDVGLKPTGRITNAFVGLQGALGIILMGLFGFVLGNRLRN